MLCHNINFISLRVVPAAGVANSYTNFLTTVVLKIHINNFIDNCSFLTFQIRQNIKMHKTIIGLFSLQRFNKDIKNPFAET